MSSFNVARVLALLIRAIELDDAGAPGASLLARHVVQQVRGAGLDHPTVVSICKRVAVVDFDLALRLRDDLFPWEEGQPLWPDPDG